MRIFSWLPVYVVLLVAVTGCGGKSTLPDGDELVARAQRAWMGDWHGVWQVEWVGAPARGPLVAEMWHAADGRLRIETLEVPSPGLSGLILVNDGQTTWLYDIRQDQLKTGSSDSARVPLASDALDAIDWLLFQAENASLDVSGPDTLESGPAVSLDIILASGDRAMLWVDDETGLPSRVELRSATWGEATFVTRSISAPGRPHPALFFAPH